MKRLIFIIIILVALVSWFILASFQRTTVSPESDLQQTELVMQPKPAK